MDDRRNGPIRAHRETHDADRAKLGDRAGAGHECFRIRVARDLTSALARGCRKMIWRCERLTMELLATVRDRPVAPREEQYAGRPVRFPTPL
jgi:hypothetical protein